MKEASPSLKEWSEKQELMRLSFLDDRGALHVMPVWFVNIDGHLCLATDSDHGKSKAFRHNSRAAWVIDGGSKPEYRGLSYTGQAEEVGDAGLRERIYNALVQKYFKSPDDPNIDRILGQVSAARTTYFKLKPESGNVWHRLSSPALI